MGETARDLSAMPRMKRRRTGLSRGGRDDGDIQRAGGIIDGGNGLFDFAEIGIAGDRPEAAGSFEAEASGIADRGGGVTSASDIGVGLEDVWNGSAGEGVVVAAERDGANGAFLEQVVGPCGVRGEVFVSGFAGTGLKGEDELVMCAADGEGFECAFDGGRVFDEVWRWGHDDADAGIWIGGEDVWG